MKTKMKDLSDNVLAMNDDVNTRWESLKNGINAIKEEEIPSKNVSAKQSLPWVTSKLRRSIRRKHKLYLKAKKSKNKKKREEYKTCKAEVQREIRAAKGTYINNHLTESLEKGDNKAFWRYIKAKRKDAVGVAPLKSDGKLHSGSKEKANLLNQQFQSVFTKSDSNESSPKLKEVKCPNIKDLKITVDGTYNLLSKIDINKASGPDNIPNAVLKECASELAPALTSIFEQSLKTGSLPSDWKNAHVTPLFKKGSRHEPSNYRPVSLTSVCCKLLEHIISRHIRNHLEKYNILTALQHGFRTGHSCETQLIITITDIIERFDKKEQIDLIILDFSKAFDTVPHEKLLCKIDHYGIRGNLYNWIKTFLTERQQTVVVDGEFSESCSVDSGVPQGTVLGPLLFLCHINDLPRAVDSSSRLFADDSLMYRSIKSQTDHLKLQKDLEKLRQWASSWGMIFNEKKCYAMTISRSRTPSDYDYSLNGHCLEKVEDNPYLGLMISNDMKWKKHIVKVANKAKAVLGLLMRNLKECPGTLREVAYTSLVRPILEYGCIVWDPHLENDIELLEKIQRRAARFVHNDFRQTSSVTAMMEKLGWLSLAERRRNHRLAFLHKIVHGKVAVPKDLVEFNNRPQRYSNDLSIRHAANNTDVKKYSFFPRTITEWNPLPNDMVMKSPLGFKNHFGKGGDGSHRREPRTSS